MNVASMPPSIGAALVLGMIQGLTEFLPVSSSGHLAAAQLLFPALSYPGVTLEITTHLGTTVAVLCYYRTLVRALVDPTAPRAPLLGLDRQQWHFLLIAGSLPTALIGFLLRDTIRAAFDEPVWIATGWLITGAVLLSSRARAPGSGRLGLPVALLVGVAQGMAIFPGISRSGVTITVALLAGVSSRQAVTYSLLLSIPAVLGATLIDAARLVAETAPAQLLFIDLLFATLAAGIIGYYCIGFVHRATRSGWWYGFAWYCWLAALVLFVVAR